jgi:hypothetical protein
LSVTISNPFISTKIGIFELNEFNFLNDISTLENKPHDVDFSILVSHGWRIRCDPGKLKDCTLEGVIMESGKEGAMRKQGLVSS